MTPPLDADRAARVRAYVEKSFEPLTDEAKAEVDTAMARGDALPGTDKYRSIVAETEKSRLAVAGQ